jgi:hypothetical protein
MRESEYPALIRLAVSGYELIVYSLLDVPRGVSFEVVQTKINIKGKVWQ